VGSDPVMCIRLHVMDSRWLAVCVL